MNKEFSKKITFMSWILSLLIVVHHITAGIRSITGSANPALDFRQLASGSVGMFFLISGYLFFRNFEFNKLLDKYKRRIKSLLIPYIIWNVGALVILLMLKKVGIYMTNTPKEINIDVLKELVLSNYTFLWFVRNLMVYVVLAPVIYFIIRNKYIFFVSEFVFVFVSIYCKVGNKTLLYFIPVYLVGGYCALHYKDSIENIRVRKKSIIATLPIFILMIATANHGNYYMYYIYTMATIVCLFVFMLGISINRELKWYMKISFYIYCSHFLLSTIFSKILFSVLKDTMLTELLVLVIAFLLVISIINISAYILKRYMKPIWNVLTGSRG